MGDGNEAKKYLQNFVKYAIIPFVLKEQVKTTIDLIKTAFFSLLTALFGIFAFVVVSFDTINTMQMIICGIGVSLVIIIFAILLYYIVKNVKKLGDME